MAKLTAVDFNEIQDGGCSLTLRAASVGGGNRRVACVAGFGRQHGPKCGATPHMPVKGTLQQQVRAAARLGAGRARKERRAGYWRGRRLQRRAQSLSPSLPGRPLPKKAVRRVFTRRGASVKGLVGAASEHCANLLNRRAAPRPAALPFPDPKPVGEDPAGRIGALCELCVRSSRRVVFGQQAVARFAPAFASAASAVPATRVWSPRPHVEWWPGSSFGGGVLAA
eukprot:363378-Chlamydomonas_euryale.AAC.5